MYPCPLPPSHPPPPPPPPRPHLRPAPPPPAPTSASPHSNIQEKITGGGGGGGGGGGHNPAHVQRELIHSVGSRSKLSSVTSLARDPFPLCVRASCLCVRVINKQKWSVYTYSNRACNTLRAPIPPKLATFNCDRGTLQMS